jgi:hypothetical protein
MDEAIRATEIVDRLAEEGIIIAKGIGDNGERLLRIGTMGNISKEDLEELARKIKDLASQIYLRKI